MRIVFFLALALSFQKTSAQINKDINVDDFLASIQKTHDAGDTMKMAFWLPTEFWDIVNRNTPEYDSNGVKLLETMVEDYIILAVVEGYFSTNGGIFKTEAELRETISLIDKDNRVYVPLSAIEVSKPLQHVISTIKPLLSNQLGELGKGFNFFYFKVKDGSNNNLISAQQKGEFTVRLNHSVFKWNLPLAAYQPTKVCPVDKQKMNAEWSYCPYHGNKVVQ